MADGVPGFPFSKPHPAIGAFSAAPYLFKIAHFGGTSLWGPDVLPVQPAPQIPLRGSDLGEATRILVEKAGWCFQAAGAPLDDIWTESNLRPWSGGQGVRTRERPPASLHFSLDNPADMW